MQMASIKFHTVYLSYRMSSQLRSHLEVANRALTYPVHGTGIKGVNGVEGFIYICSSLFVQEEVEELLSKDVL